MIKKTTKVLFAGLLFTLLLMVLSYLINVLILGKAHVKYAFLRPADDWRITPGLFITSLCWSILICLSYHYFSAKVRGRNRFVKGAKYGLFIYVFFVFFHELYSYQFIKFDFVIIAGSLIHYLLTFIIGGGLIALILDSDADS